MDNYYLQVVKDGGKPKWPRPEEELIVKSQDLGGGYTQYWAYENEPEDPDALPSAEFLASDHFSDKPALLIDANHQMAVESNKEHYLTLVVVKNGHAWGKTESSLDNLDDNITTLLDFAKEHFNMKIEHFMTTSNVPEEVEKKLDEMERSEENEKLGDGNGSEEVEAGEKEADPKEDDPWNGIKKVGSNKPAGMSSNPNFPKGSIGVGIARPSDKSSSKFWMFIPILVVLLVFVGTLMFKDQAFGKIRGLNIGGILGSAPTPTPTPTPTSTPTPTPTPEVKRGELKVRVLNGTTKSGAAAVLKEQLEEKGWEVVKTGNAKNQKLEQTIVSVKKGLQDALQVMVSDLKEDFEASAGAELTEKDTVDVEVVIGKK